MNDTVHVSTMDPITDNGYQPQYQYDYWTLLETSNVPSEQLVVEVMVDEWEMDVFLQFIDENEIIQQFLQYDTSFLLADNHLLAMVFEYWRRANYTPEQYTTYNFFVALLLAHDMEEEGDMKLNIYYWALGSEWLQRYMELDNSRIHLWRAMDYRARVTRECCEEVMSMRPDHPIWLRDRQEMQDSCLLQR